jgi:ABC-type branched-subunit amino acid transport system ATPase component/ABC-type branched-subunit amino acid transport system permease subunit
MTLLEFALLGLGAGAAYVLIAQGIVLVYRGSGIVSFAQGGLALISAQIFYGLRDSHGVPAPLAALAALATVAAIGLVMQLVVLARMQNASALARLMSSLGLLTLIEGFGVVWWGDYTQPVISGVFPTRQIELGSPQLTVGEDRICLLGLAVLVTVGLSVLYHRTSFGRATSAVAESQQIATAMGISPSLIGAANWVLGSVLAGVAGIVLAPITGLSVDALTLTVIPALAAALTGRFSSFWLTLLGGLGLGIVQSDLTMYISAPGWSSAAPFLLIIVIVVARGRALPMRGQFLERPVRAGTGGLEPMWLVPLLVVAAVLSYTLSSSWQLALSTTALVGIVGLSLVLITGYAGQLSLAQLTIAGIGALTAGNASKAGWPFPACVLAGVVAAMVVGFVVALPALRCRGMNLAVVTLGMSLAIEQLVLGNSDLAGGATGLMMQSPSLFGIDLNFTRYPQRYTLLVAGAFVLCAFVVSNIRRGRTGRRLLAVRSNERAAVSVGVDVLGAKLYAFVVGAALAGLAGALADFQFPQANLAQYTTLGSITLVVNVVVGGIGYLFGGLNGGLAGTGGIYSQALSYLGGNVVTYVTAISGVLVLLTLIAQPDGVFQGWLDVFRRLPWSRRRAVSAAMPARSKQGPVKVRTQTLSVRNMNVRFGNVRVVTDVSFDVQSGQVVGLIGPNGAGKTTVIDAVCGMVKADGEVSLGDRALHDLSARGRAQAGLGRTFQSVELFNDMTILDNICSGAHSAGFVPYLTDILVPRSAPLPDVAWQAIADLHLEADLGRGVDELPGGRRQMVGIARALATGPGLLLLDEPASGLSDAETTELGSLIRYLAETWGLAILLVEHDIQLVSSVSDHVVAMSLGEVIAEGPPAEVLATPELKAAYLGIQTAVEPGAPVASAARHVAGPAEASA